MTRRLLGHALVLALAFVIAACGDAAPPSATTDPVALRYACGTFPFGPGLLTAGPGNAEQADNPAAAALRVHLAGAGPDIDFLPDTGWHVAGINERAAEFVVVGGDRGLKMVSVENGGNGWRVTGWGDCRPRVQLAEGLGPAEWAFDPAQPRPDASTQVFDAMVTETSCASGRPADGRVVGPEIVRSADTVLLVFAVRPLPGDAQSCQGNPQTRVRVDLGEPLGSRKLLDGGTLPPGDPAAPQR